MKRTLLLFIACAVLLSLTACGDMHAAVPTPTVTPDATPNETEVAAATALPAGESNILVAYFSARERAAARRLGTGGHGRGFVQHPRDRAVPERLGRVPRAGKLGARRGREAGAG